MSEWDSAFDRAQAAYDAQEPPEDWNCEEDGHDWKRLPGEAEDGTKFAKCKKCYQIIEV